MGLFSNIFKSYSEREVKRVMPIDENGSLILIMKMIH